MADHREPNLDGDGSSSCSSSFQRTVILRDWWLVKCSKEFEGKRFGVAGTEIAASFVEKRAMRVFTSSPIIKAFDFSTLQASDGICITLRGFLDKKRVVESGFIPEISCDFIFGFPPCWEQICNKCFGGGPLGTDINTAPSVVDKACCPILSPCKNTKGNLEDSPAESRDKSTVTEKNMAEINDKDGRSSGLRARDKKTAGRKSPRQQSKSGEKSAEDVRKLELSKVQNTINDEDHGSEGLDKAKSSDVEKGECEAIDNEVILPEDGSGRKHTGADNVDKLTSRNGGESLTLEQRNGELKVTRASPHPLFKDLDKSSKAGKKGKSKKRKKALKSDGNVVEPMNHSGIKVKIAENERKLNASKVQNPTNDEDHGSEGLNNAKSSDVEKDECLAIDNEVASPVDGCGKRHTGAANVDKTTSKHATKELLTSEQRKGELKVTKTSLHSLSKDLNNSSKPGKKGKSKKSKKTLKSDRNVVEPMINSGSKVREAEEKLSVEKTKRKIDFDLEVTPDKETKKNKTNADSTGSLGQKRSRSGRVLVSPLEFWRNQVPVYDMWRNLIQVDEGHETNSTPSKGKGSNSRKAIR